MVAVQPHCAEAGHAQCGRDQRCISIGRVCSAAELLLHTAAVSCTGAHAGMVFNRGSLQRAWLQKLWRRAACNARNLIYVRSMQVHVQTSSCSFGQQAAHALPHEANANCDGMSVQADNTTQASPTYLTPASRHNAASWQGGCAPTVVAPSSQVAAATRQAVGPRNATACAALRTRATGHPAAMSASAEGPAMALAAMAAAGGSRDTYGGACTASSGCILGVWRY
jgi:hypothetical protein